MTETAPAFICPYCGTAVDAAHAHVCPECQTTHHSECWAENGGCTTFGCKCAPADEEKIQIAAPLVSHLAVEDMSDIHVMLDGKLLGPLAWQEVRDKIQSGVFTPLTKVWHSALADWTDLGSEMPQLFLQSPEASERTVLARLFAVDEEAPGLGRLAFLGCFIGGIVVAAVCKLGGMPEGMNILALIGMMILMAYRARNIGHSPWYCLFALIPCANFVVYGYFFCAPANYAESKQMDLAGYIGVCLYVIGSICLGALIAAGR